jgi:hypothetical protein
VLFQNPILLQYFKTQNRSKKKEENSSNIANISKNIKEMHSNLDTASAIALEINAIFNLLEKEQAKRYHDIKHFLNYEAMILPQNL